MIPAENQGSVMKEEAWIAKQIITYVRLILGMYKISRGWGKSTW